MISSSIEEVDKQKIKISIISKVPEQEKDLWILHYGWHVEVITCIEDMSKTSYKNH